ncbi:hypothetical protein NE237_028730 [Protea cynaroides]|uniref:Mitogen-activated protein kinase kinase kinase 1 n=1 Tax=Protea cynaroides TaxID=273540 RepID=A0A9Q0GQI1_9MAGN|nr:hypothetical protein NE237_028730 [Protea cynaroides]
MVNSVSSNSNQPPPPSPAGHQSLIQFKPFQPPIANRIARAFHRLRLVHRSGGNFFVLGASGNVYTVSLSDIPCCNCPDRTTPCKHILFVYLRVLGVSLDDTCLHRSTLRPSELNHLLSSPTSPDSWAGDRVRDRYHQLTSRLTTRGSPSREVEVEEGAKCPICLEEMRKEDRLVACRACRNPLHEQCLQRWTRIRGRRSATCVICRERWRDRVDLEQQDMYLNLADYVSDDDDDSEG